VDRGIIRVDAREAYFRIVWVTRADAVSPQGLELPEHGKQSTNQAGGRAKEGQRQDRTNHKHFVGLFSNQG
jgi:hypothetical protein